MITNLNKNLKRSNVVSIKEFLDSQKAAKESVPLYKLLLKKCEWCRTSTCVVKGTSVMMADYTFKNIEKIESGELVLNAFEEPLVVLSIVAGVEKIPTVSLEFDNGSKLMCTQRHPFYVQIDKNHLADYLEQDDMTTIGDADEAMLAAVKPKTEKISNRLKNVYCLTATELSVGMRLYSLGESSGITEIEVGPTDQEIYQLILTSEELWKTAVDLPKLHNKNGIMQSQFALRRMYPFLGLNADQHNYFTNGILSGDGIIQSGLQD